MVLQRDPVDLLPAAKRLEPRLKKNTSAPCVCFWFDKSSTPAEGEDTEVVATALGHLSGFAQRNLKHLTLFDHNLILKEADLLHVGMVPIL
ncbi:hypothetical protein F7725_028222 [Dissostichus mawsoni]|uniref:Uncharacterized protein n=1 Tax=Dissostichus mawsoni TaxID=36200 RepID=A0A7J5XF85_DISMA|nr:hypothetical protein F7725_028222 [Dissostichus mawsoni]